MTATTRRPRLRTPHPIGDAKNGVRVVGMRMLSEDHVLTAICRVIEGEIHDWPFSRPPTHCVTLPI